MWHNIHTAAKVRAPVSSSRSTTEPLQSATYPPTIIYVHQHTHTPKHTSEYTVSSIYTIYVYPSAVAAQSRYKAVTKHNLPANNPRTLELKAVRHSGTTGLRAARGEPVRLVLLPVEVRVAWVRESYVYKCIE